MISIKQSMIQWPCNRNRWRLEEPTIYRAYFSGLWFRGYPHNIWPYVVQYLNLRILEITLTWGKLAKYQMFSRFVLVVYDLVKYHGDVIPRKVPNKSQLYVHCKFYQILSFFLAFETINQNTYIRGSTWQGWSTQMINRIRGSRHESSGVPWIMANHVMIKIGSARCLFIFMTNIHSYY